MDNKDKTNINTEDLSTVVGGNVDIQSAEFNGAIKNREDESGNSGKRIHQ